MQVEMGAPPLQRSMYITLLPRITIVNDCGEILEVLRFLALAAARTKPLLLYCSLTKPDTRGLAFTCALVRGLVRAAALVRGLVRAAARYSRSCVYLR
jgi:hypothetical protein